LRRNRNAKTHILLGDLDLIGGLIIGLIFLISLGGFTLVVVFIFRKVFRGKEDITTIDLAHAGVREDERR